MKELIFRGKYSNGKIQFYADDWVNDQLKQYDGEDVYCTVKRNKPTRSLRQNNWYYGVCVPYVQHFILETQGEKYSKDDVHQYHLNHVVKPEIEIKPIFGTPCTVYKIQRTSEMSTVEFMEFKEKVQAYWATMDLFIPDPE